MTTAWQGCAGPHRDGIGESGFELGMALFAEGPGAADGESPRGPSPAAGPAPG